MARIKKSDRAMTIVGEGAIGNPDIEHGRLIPVLVVDCADRPDIYELIMLHQGQSPGDVISTWAKNFLNTNFLYLLLEYERPNDVG
jgi:hypothetical protein